MNIQKKPMTRQIQPIGFSGRLEEIRAPTTGKARKGTKINRSLTMSETPPPLAVCADLESTYNTTLAANMANERPARDQASHTVVRLLIQAVISLVSVEGSFLFRLLQVA
jgi:hypothetical protein